MFSRLSDVKCSFVSPNFALFRIIRTAEDTPPEPNRTSTKYFFVKIFKGFQLLTVFIKSSILQVRLGFEYAASE